MNCPEPSVFVACPLSTARDLAGTERLVHLFCEAFAGRGWKVRPERTESVAGLSDRLRAGGGGPLVARNIEGIVTSDLLLVIATEMDEPSSVWVEAGAALARGVPLVVVAAPAVRVPFLVRAADGSAATGAHCRLRQPSRSCSIHRLSTGGVDAQVTNIMSAITGDDPA